jgi:hypothetical protein
MKGQIYRQQRVATKQPAVVAGTEARPHVESDVNVAPSLVPAGPPSTPVRHVTHRPSCDDTSPARDEAAAAAAAAERSRRSAMSPSQR